MVAWVARRAPPPPTPRALQAVTSWVPRLARILAPTYTCGDRRSWGRPAPGRGHRGRRGQGRIAGRAAERRHAGALDGGGRRVRRPAPRLRGRPRDVPAHARRAR